MAYVLLRWLLNTLALFVVVQVVPGFHAGSWMTLAIAALVLGLMNAIIRPILFVLTLPLTILTIGLFLIVLNGIMLELTAWLVPGFRIDSFGWACVGAIVLGLISLITHRIGRRDEAPRRDRCS
ncbi:MAG TPA: phage holin family protein [Thermoanaerobaculia bacterium]|nr:phage holin family protein [Thermoanaerobaculia bacterium]